MLQDQIVTGLITMTAGIVGFHLKELANTNTRRQEIKIENLRDQRRRIENLLSEHLTSVVAIQQVKPGAWDELNTHTANIYKTLSLIEINCSKELHAAADNLATMARIIGVNRTNDPIVSNQASDIQNRKDKFIRIAKQELEDILHQTEQAIQHPIKLSSTKRSSV